MLLMCYLVHLFYTSVKCDGIWKSVGVMPGELHGHHSHFKEDFQMLYAVKAMYFLHIVH